MPSTSPPHADNHTAGGAGGGCPCKAQSDPDFTDLDSEDTDVHATTEGRVADKARYPAWAAGDATTEPIFPPELALAAPRALFLRSAKVGVCVFLFLFWWVGGGVDMEGLDIGERTYVRTQETGNE